MPTQPGHRSYRMKKGDSALTVPNRVTFPQGTYINQPLNMSAGYGSSPFTQTNPYRQPYQMGTGTPASGISGNQGASSAMYPAGSSFYQNYNIPNTTMSSRPANSPYYQNYNIQSKFYPPPGTDTFKTSGMGGVTQNQFDLVGSILTGGQPNMQAPPLQPGQYMNPLGAVQQGATPFGTNAYGERLDSSGNVWNPDTATTDIYGGKFIQEGAVTWERNSRGKLIRVKHMGGGKKKIVAGSGRNERPAPRPQQSVQQTVQQPSIANAFVSFRA
jgi:hypothetical protein